PFYLVILHARNMGNWVAAYYASSSQYPTEAVATSNEAEMFFVNLDTMSWAIGTPDYESVLAHEFQHMVHWFIDQNEESWLNEGRSELAAIDRKSTRLNSSHVKISYAVFCLKKKTTNRGTAA